MNLNQQIIKIGKYLYKHLDGAIRQKSSGNTYDVNFLVLYQLPRLMQVPGRQAEGYNDMHEMILNINLTTYANKIRMNVTEISPNEKTLGHIVIDDEDMLSDLASLRKYALNRIHRWLYKEYEAYEFLF